VTQPLARPCDLGRAANPDRYRMTHRNGKRVKLHRAVFEDANGPQPPEVFICHHCDTPACAELTHLYPGDNTANMRDAVARGRLRRSPAHIAAMQRGRRPTSGG
jgi:hypothetical protein